MHTFAETRFGNSGLVLLAVLSLSLSVSASPRAKRPTFRQNEESLRAIAAYDQKYENSLPKISGKLLQILLPPRVGAKVQTVAFSSDGQFLAAGDEDANLRLWNTRDWKKSRNLKGDPASITKKYGLAFAPTGKFVIGASGSEARMWEVGTGKLVRSFAKQPTELLVGAWNAAFSKDGKFIAISNIKGNIAVWDTQNWRQTLSLNLLHPVDSLSFSPNGKNLAIGLGNFSVQLLNIGTKRITRIFRVPFKKGLVEILGSAAAYSPNGKLLASVSDNERISLWDVSSGKKLRSLRGPRYMQGLSLSPNGRLVAAGSLHGYVEIWDARNGKVLQLGKGHDRAVTSTAFSPDGRFLATCSNDGTTKIWDCRFPHPKQFPT